MKKGFLLIWAILAMAGCQKTSQVETVSPLCAQGVSVEQTMQAAEKELYRMGFELEKYDFADGILITRPLRGGQFFELWRGDNTSGQAFAESNMHSIRRIVQLRFRPDAGGVCMECQTQVQRLSINADTIRGRGSLAGQFTESSSRQQGLGVKAESKDAMTWIELGRDAALETKILRHIEKHITKG